MHFVNVAVAHNRAGRRCDGTGLADRISSTISRCRKGAGEYAYYAPSARPRPSGLSIRSARSDALLTIRTSAAAGSMPETASPSQDNRRKDRNALSFGYFCRLSAPCRRANCCSGSGLWRLPKAGQDRSPPHTPHAQDGILPGSAACCGTSSCTTGFTRGVGCRSPLPFFPHSVSRRHAMQRIIAGFVTALAVVALPQFAAAQDGKARAAPGEGPIPRRCSTVSMQTTTASSPQTRFRRACRNV